MSDETIVDTLRKASRAIYIAVEEETAKQISITFTRAAERIAGLEAQWTECVARNARHCEENKQQAAEIAALKAELARAREELISVWVEPPRYPESPDAAEARYKREIAQTGD